MNEALAVSRMQVIKDRRTTLISNVMHGNGSQRTVRIMQQEIRRITLVLNQKV